jgi:DNA-binding response OmpR family regulator
LLLVDNDPRIVELVALFLGRRGYAVRTARSYREARALLAEERPDLVLADLDLGAERGETELASLSRGGVLPPTLVVSGFLDREIDTRLRLLPEIVGTLSKPFGLEELEDRIAALLGDPEHAPFVSEAGKPRRRASSNSQEATLDATGPRRTIRRSTRPPGEVPPAAVC